MDARSELLESTAAHRALDAGNPHSAPDSTLARRCGAALGAAALGIVLLYGAGFAQSDILHNGAHDARHSANFPCH